MNQHSIEDAFASYVATLRETPASEKTEHTDREAIKPLLHNFTGSRLTIVHEPKRVPGKGAPDFKVRHNGQIVGYLETKALGSDLKAILKSNQIERYGRRCRRNYQPFVFGQSNIPRNAAVVDENVRPNLDF